MYLHRSQSCRTLAVDTWTAPPTYLLGIMLLLEYNLHRSLSFQVSSVDWEKGVSLVRDHSKGLEPSLK